MTEQLVIRSATLDDIDRLMHLSHLVGSGMTSMPTDEQSWIKKLERSIADFGREQPNRSGDIYFMVMEDLANNNIVGSGAVYSGIGLDEPFYSYKLTTITSTSEKLDLTVHARVLTLVNDFTGASEVGSLFLVPQYRKNGIGKFLSRARFLLLADFPARFSDTVIAEMRGWLNDKDQSPFWESLGHKFFELSFQEADFISAVDGFQFISDLMPKYPVYVNLLSEEAQDVIGKAHKDTTGALRILENEGFRFNGYVDIFDAGPTLSTPLNQIKTVADSVSTKVSRIVDDSQTKGQPSYILSNSRLPDYRMTRAPLAIDDNGELAIGQSAADALQIGQDDTLRYVPERTPKEKKS